jgi:hypothetical protein
LKPPPKAGSRIDLEAELDRLFALKPGEFVSARNELAAHLKASGDAPAAARVKALKRPSVPAWAVNQLRFATPRLVAGLLASGDRLRSRSPDMPSVMQARREAVSDARKKSAELLVAAGHSATPQMMQRVSSTLEALATYGNAPDRDVAGRLMEELPAPGFDELAALGVLNGAAGTKARVDRQKRPSSQAPASVPATTPRRIEEKESRANRAKEIAEAKRQERAHAPALSAARQAVPRAERAARAAATAEARLSRQRARSGS